MTKELKEILQKQIALVDSILDRYTDDEAGENQLDKYNAMSDFEIINLLTNTLTTCSSWEDFETDLIINFDYNNY